MKFRILAILCLISTFLYAQNTLLINNGFQVDHYDFFIHLDDTKDEIQGKAIIQGELLPSFNKELKFDFITKNITKFGMNVQNVKSNGQDLEYELLEEKIIIKWDKLDSVFLIEIEYAGIPEDGLVISKTKTGKSTFFGDNWPNRARYWLPCVDHPSDKATVNFTVTAPSKFQVVANGQQVEETNNFDGTTTTAFKESAEIAMKVAVIGVAEFAVQQLGEVNNIPISTWVFSDKRDDGFYDYEQAKKVFTWFFDKFGDYPYEKLANVQSKTRYGGMENASNIFYYENSVTGNRDVEDLFAHEIAHQWFGNSVSEEDWAHIWLSEGFATYLTDLYIESIYGNDDFVKRLKGERDKVVRFSRTYKHPLVNTEEKVITKLLNPDSYQKGAWVLHMLRHKMGYKLFFQGLKKYYTDNKDGNANTETFRKVMENVSGQNLHDFFQIWCYNPGHPIIHGFWDNKSGNKVVINLEQENTIFRFPLEIGLYDENKELISVKTIDFKGKKILEKFAVSKQVYSLELDPNCKLLFEGKVIANK